MANSLHLPYFRSRHVAEALRAALHTGLKLSGISAHLHISGGDLRHTILDPHAEASGPHIDLLRKTIASWAGKRETVITSLKMATLTGDMETWTIFKNAMFSALSPSDIRSAVNLIPAADQTLDRVTQWIVQERVKRLDAIQSSYAEHARIRARQVAKEIREGETLIDATTRALAEHQRQGETEHREADYLARQRDEHLARCQCQSCINQRVGKSVAWGVGHRPFSQLPPSDKAVAVAEERQASGDRVRKALIPALESEQWHARRQLDTLKNEKEWLQTHGYLR